MKDKLLLDASVFALLIICMEYNATGSFLHEFAGIIMLTGMMTHFFINLKYYKVMTNGKAGKLSTKNKLALGLNLILPLTMISMFISSCVISKELLIFMNIETSHYELWRNIHIISACVMLTASFAHILMHIKMLRRLIEKNISSKSKGRIITAVSCAAAVLTGGYVIKSDVHYFSESTPELSVNETKTSEKKSLSPADSSYKKVSESVTEEIQESSARSSESEHVSETLVTEAISEAIDNAVSEAIEENKKREESAESQITEATPESNEVKTADLEEYLSKLVCTGCGRRCPLTAPQCRKGESQVQRATEEFYNS